MAAFDVESQRAPRHGTCYTFWGHGATALLGVLLRFRDGSVEAGFWERRAGHRNLALEELLWQQFWVHRAAPRRGTCFAFLWTWRNSAVARVMAGLAVAPQQRGRSCGSSFESIAWTAVIWDALRAFVGMAPAGFETCCGFRAARRAAENWDICWFAVATALWELLWRGGRFCHSSDGGVAIL